MQPTGLSRSRITLLLVLAAIGLYALVFAASQRKIIYTDESWFARDFSSIARGDWAKPDIPHPPLYTALGALMVRVFGETFAAMRLVGASAFVATLALIAPAARALEADANRAERAAWFAIVAYAIHPLALQGSLLLDIDNTIFTPAMLLLVLALARTEAASFARRVVWVGLATVLMLWTKLLPTSAVLIGCVLATTLFRRRLFASTLTAFALGGALFAASFALVSNATGFPTSALIGTFMRVGAPADGGPARMLSRLVMGGGISAVWLAIPFMALFALAAYARLRELLNTREVRLNDALFLTVVVGWLAYAAGNELPMGFPRYHFPLLVLMLILTGLWLARFAWLRRDVLIVAGSALLVAAYLLAVMPDPLLPQYLLTFETNDVRQRVVYGLGSQAVALLIPFALLCVIARGLRPSAPWLAVACLSYCFAVWGVTTLTQARADYSTIYEYGRTGAAQTASLLRERVAPDAPVAAPNEILYATGRRNFLVNDFVGPGKSAEKFLSWAEANRPAAIVMTLKEDGRYVQVTRDARVQALLADCYPDRASVGAYLVFVRARANCVAQ